MSANDLTFHRPHFFAGQWIDFKDLNRLSQTSVELLTGVLQHVFKGGGVLVGALDEFRVERVGEGKYVVHPGVAVLPSGECSVLPKNEMVEIPAALLTAGDCRVFLRNQVRAFDRVQDVDDPSIVGFKSEALDAELFLVHGDASAEGLFLFRVLSDGKIATGERREILPPTFQVAFPLENNALNDVVRELESQVQKVRTVYGIEDAFFSHSYISRLREELLAQPSQPAKIRFLLAEIARALGLYLDTLEHRLRGMGGQYSKQNLLGAISVLETLRAHHDRDFPLTHIVDVNRHLREFVDFAEKNFSLLNVVEEALHGIKDRALTTDAQIVLGGRVFARVDQVLASDEKRAVTETKTAELRGVTTRYTQGDTFTAIGKFTTSGAYEIDLENTDPNRPLVLLFRQYVRREGTVVHYQINGRHLDTHRTEGSGYLNNWVNRGLFVPHDLLSPQGNRFRIEIEKVDQEFGFFDLFVYQPVHLSTGGL